MIDIEPIPLVMCRYARYSLLRTVEDDRHIGELGVTSDHAQVATMNEFLGR